MGGWAITDEVVPVLSPSAPVTGDAVQKDVNITILPKMSTACGVVHLARVLRLSSTLPTHLPWVLRPSLGWVQDQ